jgi:hypothetical protein
LDTFLRIDKDVVRTIGGGRKPKGKIDVAVMQSLSCAAAWLAADPARDSPRDGLPHRRTLGLILYASCV